MRNYFTSSNQSSINNFPGGLLSPDATHGNIIMGDATYMGDATCMDDAIHTKDSAYMGKIKQKKRNEKNGFHPQNKSCKYQHEQIRNHIQH